MRRGGGPDAAPESGVEEHDFHRGLQEVGGQLLEVDHHRVGRQRYPDLGAVAAQAVQAERGVFVVVVAQPFDAAAEFDSTLHAQQYRGPSWATFTSSR